MQKITPFLWFDNNAEEAANFIPLFSKTQIIDGADYGQSAAEVSKIQKGAVSFFVKCQTLLF
jgi:predicted 3-demethylubiquinone-9 3-methyltransferase (glyoxalase superfamily)